MSSPAEVFPMYPSSSSNGVERRGESSAHVKRLARYFKFAFSTSCFLSTVLDCVSLVDGMIVFVTPLLLLLPTDLNKQYNINQLKDLY